MKTWQELALEYAAQGLKPFEVARKIESELGLTNMYDKVYGYIKRHIGETEKKEDGRYEWIYSAFRTRVHSFLQFH